MYLLVVTGRGFLDIFFFCSVLEVASSIFEINNIGKPRFKISGILGKRVRYMYLRVA